MGAPTLACELSSGTLRIRQRHPLFASTEAAAEFRCRGRQTPVYIGRKLAYAMLGEQYHDKSVAMGIWSSGAI